VGVHRDAYVAAFDGFDVTKVAAYSEADIERLMTTGGVIHSRAKIQGTIQNARTLIDLEREYGSIRTYQESFRGYAAIRTDTKRRFAYMGDLNTYYWLFRTAAPVPDVEGWMAEQERDHPRVREMVTFHGKQKGRG